MHNFTLQQDAFHVPVYPYVFHLRTFTVNLQSSSTPQDTNVGKGKAIPVIGRGDL
jgi:hypothetical protein